MTKLSKKYGVSDVALAKTCKKLGVPRPGRGYWAKAPVARKRPTLPPLRPGQQEEITVNRWETRNPTKSPALVKPVGNIPELKVKSRLKAPHPLVALTFEHLKKTELERERRRSLGAHKGLDVRVSKDLLPRAMRIMDCLITEFEARNFTVIIKEGRQACTTHVTIGTIPVRFLLKEKVRRIPYQLTKNEQKRRLRGEHVYTPPYDFAPTEILELVIDEWPRSKWSDRKTKTLESQLGEFIVGVEQTAKVLLQQKKDREEESRQYELRRQQAIEAERIRKAEEAQIAELKKLASIWRENFSLRKFIQEVEQATEEYSKEEKELFEIWSAWARRVADKDDPIKRFPEILSRWQSAHAEFN